jgi:hypothetical protein
MEGEDGYRRQRGDPVLGVVTTVIMGILGFFDNGAGGSGHGHRGHHEGRQAEQGN